MFSKSVKTLHKTFSIRTFKKQSLPVNSSMNYIFSPSITTERKLFFSSKSDGIKKPETKNKKKQMPPKQVILDENPTGKLETVSFKAKTQEILDIVSKSIYTNKESFIREIISNASDATELLRFRMQQNPNAFKKDVELKITVETDPKNNRIIIQDNGIGMDKKQLTENLGTIAGSGSKNFLKSLEKGGETAASIIGQFGVGFYSAFMVSSLVEVYTKSSVDKNAPAFYWKSDGKGTFSISEAKNVEEGTKVIINLSREFKDFSDIFNVERIIKQHSNFVKFPIFLNGKKINVQGALWVENPKEVSDKQHEEFYKHITNAYDPPLFTIHFHKDFPLSLQALFYIPKYHSEKYGNSRMKPGVSIYCRKVLIQKESPEILPDWLRFVKGVVDSEQISLNISRESTQNKETLQKIKRVLVKRILSDLKTINASARKKYTSFYNEYSVFLKEGVCTDNEFREFISPLLLFDSSKLCNEENEGGKEKKGELRSLDDYVSSMKEGQRKIYYIVSSNRQAAVNSPYYESLKNGGREVLFLYTPIDEFVMQAISNYQKRPLVSIEDTRKVDESDIGKFDEKKAEFVLEKEQVEDLCQWMKETLGSKVKSVSPTTRIKNSPAIVTGHENASVQIMMQLAHSSENSAASPQKLEINPNHKVMRGLFYTMGEPSDKAMAKRVAEQVLDNALIDAGLVKDPRVMLGRMNEVMAAALDVEGIEMELREKKKEIKGKSK